MITKNGIDVSLDYYVPTPHCYSYYDKGPRGSVHRRKKLRIQKDKTYFYIWGVNLYLNILKAGSIELIFLVKGIRPMKRKAAAKIMKFCRDANYRPVDILDSIEEALIGYDELDKLLNEEEVIYEREKNKIEEEFRMERKKLNKERYIKFEQLKSHSDAELNIVSKQFNKSLEVIQKKLPHVYTRSISYTYKKNLSSNHF